MLIHHPSPNFDTRDQHPVDMLVMHYTGMNSADAAIQRLCDTTSKVSAHYVVDEDGAIFVLVNESKRAWHAGVSHWRGHHNINQRSIGIEIVNPGHELGYRPFPLAQMKAVAKLSKDILTRHTIPPRNIVGHSDIAPTRKQDPGELFDWHWLASQGVGLGVRDSGLEPNTPVPNAQSLMPLQTYGYDTSDPPAAILAFQRHFRPKNLSGEWDSECEQILKSLLDGADKAL